MGSKPGGMTLRAFRQQVVNRRTMRNRRWLRFALAFLRGVRDSERVIRQLRARAGARRWGSFASGRSNRGASDRFLSREGEESDSSYSQAEPLARPSSAALEGSLRLGSEGDQRHPRAALQELKGGVGMPLS